MLESGRSDQSAWLGDVSLCGPDEVKGSDNPNMNKGAEKRSLKIHSSGLLEIRLNGPTNCQTHEAKDGRRLQGDSDNRVVRYGEFGKRRNYIAYPTIACHGRDMWLSMREFDPCLHPFPVLTLACILCKHCNLSTPQYTSPSP